MLVHEKLGTDGRQVDPIPTVVIDHLLPAHGIILWLMLSDGFRFFSRTIVVFFVEQYKSTFFSFPGKVEEAL